MTEPIGVNDVAAVQYPHSQEAEIVRLGKQLIKAQDRIKELEADLKYLERDARDRIKDHLTRWICTACGQEFEIETFSHARHHPSCDGYCKNCPIECGPVEKIEDGTDFMFLKAKIKELEATLRDYCDGPGCMKCEDDTHDPKV